MYNLYIYFVKYFMKINVMLRNVKYNKILKLLYDNIKLLKVIYVVLYSIFVLLKNRYKVV